MEEIQTTEDRPIWEQQPGEPNSAYGYFLQYYVNAPEGKRSYQRAYNQFRAERGKTPVTRMPGNWRLWASQINKAGKHTGGPTWQERFIAYEEYQARLRQEALHLQVLKDAHAWAEMQQVTLQQEREAGDVLYERAKQMSSAPVFTRTSRVGDNGETIVIINAAGWREADIANTFRMSSDLKRRGLLMPRDGQSDTEDWKDTLRKMDLDPDDPESWLALLDIEPDDASSTNGGGMAKENPED